MKPIASVARLTISIARSLVAVTNYATDYREIVPPDRPRLNLVVTQITQAYGGVVADSYSPFLNREYNYRLLLGLGHMMLVLPHSRCTEIG